ncbi:protein PIN-LIKES 3 [Arachis hypogaea]|uniref:protein PIN-LIKES 3 n=1 Tax=Arachis hypogaea TaxID=3818 RepID=UPI000DECB6E3|nr:protein PIN-LIKES 3 [Arachis hypogaea]
MDFLKLFIVALMSVLKLLLLTSVGIFLALDRIDILNDIAMKHLNSLVFYVFTPALISSSLAKTITLRSMIMLWFMPLNIFITYIIGSALGWLLNKISRVPHHLQGVVLGCCSAGNMGNLLLIIVPAVCKENGNYFGANKDVCYRNGLGYASLSQAVGNIYMWSYVYNIIRIYSNKNSSVAQVDDSEENELENISRCSNEQLVNVESKSETTHHVDQFEIMEHAMPIREAKVTRMGNVMKQMQILVKKIDVKTLLSPSTIGSMVGLVIGVVPQFRKVLVGDGAALRVVQDSVTMLGDALIPSLTLVLGANLLKGLKGQSMNRKIIVGIVVVKGIAVPAIGIGIIKGATRFGLINPDPLYQFVLLLQYAVPPAVAISTVTQLFGAGEGECSVIMLATYACATVFLTLWCTFFMWLVL